MPRSPDEQPSATTVRVDPAHVAADGRPAAGCPTDRPVIESVAALAGLEPTAHLARQLHTQASQLAKHLQHQQGDLDRRESELHARSAGIENEMRGARLWLEERQSDLAQREAEIVRREAALDGLQAQSQATGRGADLEARESDLAEFEAKLDQRHASLEEQFRRLAGERRELEDRHRELDERQAQLYQDIEQHSHQRAQLAGDRAELESFGSELDARGAQMDVRQQELDRQSALSATRDAELQQYQAELEAAAEALSEREEFLAERGREIDTAIARFEHLGVTEERIEQLEEDLARFLQRQKLLDDAEALLASQHTDLKAAQAGLRAERNRHEERIRVELDKMAEERRRFDADLGRQKEVIRRRSDQLDARENALEQLRLDLGQLQRETLEMRLVTEELWAQLSGPLAPAALTRSLGQIRAQLADHYRLADEQLARRKEEIQALAQGMGNQHATLVAQKQELNEWLARRREDIEQQAARLVAREQELDRQQAHFEGLERGWQEERRDLQRRISELLTRLRTADAIAA